MDTIAIGTLYVATFINAAMPGPCAVLAASRTARHGIRSGLLVSVGVVVSDVVFTGLALAAMLGALTLSATVLVAMKWAGVLALLLFATRTLRPAPALSGSSHSTISTSSDLCTGSIAVLSSPFTLVFLLALLPQFMSANGSIFGPALIAAGVFVAGAATAQLAAVLFGACALQLGSTRGRWVEHAGAVLLLGFAGAAVITPVS